MKELKFEEGNESSPPVLLLTLHGMPQPTCRLQSGCCVWVGRGSLHWWEFLGWIRKVGEMNLTEKSGVSSRLGPWQERLWGHCHQGVAEGAMVGLATASRTGCTVWTRWEPKPVAFRPLPSFLVSLVLGWRWFSSSPSPTTTATCYLRFVWAALSRAGFVWQSLKPWSERISVRLSHSSKALAQQC